VSIGACAGMSSFSRIRQAKEMAEVGNGLADDEVLREMNGGRPVEVLDRITQFGNKGLLFG
jgi:hypothetical protein